MEVVSAALLVLVGAVVLWSGADPAWNFVNRLTGSDQAATHLPGDDARPAIAVLPLVEPSGVPDHAFFADGIAGPSDGIRRARERAGDVTSACPAIPANFGAFSAFPSGSLVTAAAPGA